MKKIIIAMLFGLSATLTAGLTFAADDVEGKNFDHGNDYGECMDNCRNYHRNVLQWRRGRGKGLCWNECKNAHPSKRS